MSLRKSPELTPALLAAARSNAQQSTGPRSPAARQNVKLNALKHGAYARDENRHKTMLALGEDPEQLQTLTEELGIKGWRMGLIFRLLHRFGDPIEIRDQQADEEWKAFLRRQGDNCDVPGEPEREELLRLLGEEIASVKEEFEYAEMANAERVELERDACLAPEGETWAMLLHQEASLDRSIDRKVRILLRLRKELPNLPLALPGEDDGARIEGTRKILAMTL